MTRGFGKFLVAVLLVGVLCAASAFAADATGTITGDVQTNPASFTFKSFSRLALFLTGAIPGGIVLVKFVLDIVKAYANREQNPSGRAPSVPVRASEGRDAR